MNEEQQESKHEKRDDFIRYAVSVIISAIVTFIMLL